MLYYTIIAFIEFLEEEFSDPIYIIIFLTSICILKCFKFTCNINNVNIGFFSGDINYGSDDKDKDKQSTFWKKFKKAFSKKNNDKSPSSRGPSTSSRSRFYSLTSVYISTTN